MIKRVTSLVATLAAVSAVVVIGPATTASAAECAAPWNSSSVYTGGGSASYNGHNWNAKWWTQNETPGTSDVWADQGACGGGGTNPGDPDPSGFVVSEAQFNQMFPNRNPFYTYSGLTAALSAYPGFANTGSDTVKRQEAAAFLANVSHETGGLVYIVEQNTANYPHYCDTSQSYGCPAGTAAYYGRARSSSAGTSTTRPRATRSASTFSTTRTWWSRTRPWPGRRAFGTGTRRTAPAP